MIALSSLAPRFLGDFCFCSKEAGCILRLSRVAMSCSNEGFSERGMSPFSV